MEAQMEANWFDGSEDELVQELLDNESPLFVLPPEIIEPVADSITNVYSGPRIEDIESALLITGQDIESNDGNIISQHGISILERGLSKIDNKYTLKIKSCGNGMADDGYKWRKYGQKSIKNSPYPRSYYRCTNPRCSAKKQMERSTEDPDMLIVTYEGLHLHFTYSHFLPTQPQHMYQYPPIKKPKKTHSPTETQHEQVVEAAQGEAQENPVLVEVEPLPPSPPIPPSPIILDYQEELCQGGLLEDVVPLMIRKPSFSNTSSNSSCSSSYPSSPPTSSSCSISWSPNFSSINVGDGTL